MCQLVKIGNTELPDKIRIEFQRRADLRAIDVFLINHDRYDVEGQGVLIRCFDNGKLVMPEGPEQL